MNKPYTRSGWERIFTIYDGQWRKGTWFWWLPTRNALRFHESLRGKRPSTQSTTIRNWASGLHSTQTDGLKTGSPSSSMVLVHTYCYQSRKAYLLSTTSGIGYLSIHDTYWTQTLQSNYLAATRQIPCCPIILRNTTRVPEESEARYEDHISGMHGVDESYELRILYPSSSFLQRSVSGGISKGQRNLECIHVHIALFTDWWNGTILCKVAWARYHPRRDATGMQVYQCK